MTNRTGPLSEIAHISFNSEAAFDMIEAMSDRLDANRDDKEAARLLDLLLTHKVGDPRQRA